MKPTKHAAAGVFLAVFAVLSACSPAVTWKEYVYKDHGFAVSFTAPPTTSTPSNSFLAQLTDGADEFGAVSTCNSATTKSTDQILSDTVDALRGQGTVSMVTYVATGETVGREMLVDQPGKPTVRQRIFARDKCLYQVYARVHDGPDAETATHFLDSFRLL